MSSSAWVDLCSGDLKLRLTTELNRADARTTFFNGRSEDKAGKNGEWKKDGELYVRGGLGSELTSLVVHIWVEKQVPPLLIYISREPIVKHVRELDSQAMILNIQDTEMHAIYGCKAQDYEHIDPNWRRSAYSM